MKVSDRPFWFRPGLFNSSVRLLGMTALFAGLTLFVAACGGDDDAASSGSATTTSATAAPPSGGSGVTAPTSAPDSTGSTGTTGSSGAEAVGTAVGTSPGPLADLNGLQSFRWDITLSGGGAFLASAGVPTIPGASSSDFTASGAYIAPDQAQVTIRAGGIEYKQTVKGDQQWTTIAGTTTGPVPATVDAGSLNYVSAFVDPQSLIDDTAIDCGSHENVNGVDALRCETTEAMNQQLVTGFAGAGAETTDASFVLWVATEGNYIVRWEFNAEGTANGDPFKWNFVANITDVNGVNSIEP